MMSANAEEEEAPSQSAWDLLARQMRSDGVQTYLLPQCQ